MDRENVQGKPKDKETICPFLLLLFFVFQSRIPINLYFTYLYACVVINFFFAAVFCFILTKQGLMEDHQIVYYVSPCINIRIKKVIKYLSLHLILLFFFFHLLLLRPVFLLPLLCSFSSFAFPLCFLYCRTVFSASAPQDWTLFTSTQDYNKKSVTRSSCLSLCNIRVFILFMSEPPPPPPSLHVYSSSILSALLLPLLAISLVLFLFRFLCFL